MRCGGVQARGVKKSAVSTVHRPHVRRGGENHFCSALVVCLEVGLTARVTDRHAPATRPTAQLPTQCLRHVVHHPYHRSSSATCASRRATFARSSLFSSYSAAARAAFGSCVRRSCGLH